MLKAWAVVLILIQMACGAMVDDVKAKAAIADFNSQLTKRVGDNAVEAVKNLKEESFTQVIGHTTYEKIL